MESDKARSLDGILPLHRDFRQNKGGRNLVNGWSPENWASFGEYVQEGFNQNTLVHSSFKSAQEAVKFITGVGEYSDRNSFFYTDQDCEEFQQEGFFQTMQCPECLEDLKDQLEQDSMPEDEIVDPEVLPTERKYQGKSFKLEEEKYVEELWYQCRDHPEIYLMKKETSYE